MAIEEDLVTIEIERELRSTKSILSQQIAQLAIRTREEKSVAKKENFVVIEIVKESKKSCRDRVDKLKRKILVATKKIMSR